VVADLFYCFVDFKKDFDTIPRENRRKRLEEIMFPLNSRVVVAKLYKDVIATPRTTEGWSKNNKCNVGVIKVSLIPYVFLHIHR